VCACDGLDLRWPPHCLTAAPHNHGVHARRTSTVHAFWIVLEGSPQALPLTVFLSDGTEAMALFSGQEEARMFCHFCEKGASSNIRQTTAGEGDGHIVGYYAPAAGTAADEDLGHRGGAKRRVGAPRGGPVGAPTP
jgi:hypothetical protein